MIRLFVFALALLAQAPFLQAANTEGRHHSAFYSAVIGKLDGMRALAESWELMIGPNAILSLEHRFLRITSKINHGTREGTQKSSYSSQECAVESDKTAERVAGTLIKQLGKLEGEIRELRPFNMLSPNMWHSFQEILLQTAGRMLKGFNEAAEELGLAIRINLKTRRIELNRHRGQRVKEIWRVASAKRKQLLDRCKVAYHESTDAYEQKQPFQLTLFRN
jgi:hypothetical protein